MKTEIAGLAARVNSCSATVNPGGDKVESLEGCWQLQLHMIEHEGIGIARSGQAAVAGFCLEECITLIVAARGPPYAVVIDTDSAIAVQIGTVTHLEYRIGCAVSL